MIQGCFNKEKLSANYFHEPKRLRIFSPVDLSEVCLWQVTADPFIIVSEEEEEGIEAPKVLGDIFESVAGAIFLDSGMDLTKTWGVYYRMMKPYIGKLAIATREDPPPHLLRRVLSLESSEVVFLAISWKRSENESEKVYSAWR